MSTIVVAGIDAGGNVPPTIGIGRELHRRGWRVLVHGDEALRNRVEGAGLEFVPAAAPQLDPVRPRASASAILDVVRLFADTRRAEDVVALCRRVAADVALVDVTLMRVIVACSATLPTAVLCHTSWDSVGQFAGPPYSRVLDAVGIHLARSLAAADRILVASPAVLDPVDDLPRNAVRVGAVLQDPPTAARREGAPLVLVSSSSFWYPRQAQQLERLAEAVVGLGAEVLVTTGRTVDPATVRTPPGVQVRGLVDHGLVLPRAALLVGHGGHASTVRALAHGVPLLVVPLNRLSDQPRLGRVVARRGLGLTVRKGAPVGRLRAAAATVLHRPAFREAAARAGAQLRARDGAAVAADELARMAGEG